MNNMKRIPLIIEWTIKYLTSIFRKADLIFPNFLKCCEKIISLFIIQNIIKLINILKLNSAITNKLFRNTYFYFSFSVKILNLSQ